MDLSKLRINAARLQSSLEEMAKIGATPANGVQRLTLTDEDKKARELLIKWLKEIDCEVQIDSMGCIFGIRKGKNNNLAPIVSGSHVDSQPKGGRFDGILGVMGALEVLRTLHDNKIVTERPIIIVDWTNEEGSRFQPAMVASGVWAGVLQQEYAYGRTDRNGKVFVDELKRIGFQGTIPCKHKDTHAYFELHIEQGPVLEQKNKQIGAPKGVLCLHWYDIYLEGEANQVGPTPMVGRHDALVAAAEMILKVRDLPTLMGGNMVATVGEIQNEPNSRNIIPDKVHFTVDIRSWDDEYALRSWDVLLKQFEEIAVRNGCPMKHVVTWRVKHAEFNKRLFNMVLDKANMLGYQNMEWVSGAGHDASYVNQVYPTAMIFVPSVNGRSHVECELTKWEDCAAGVNVLLHCIMEAANEK